MMEIDMTIYVPEHPVDDRLIARKEVELLTSLSRSTIYRLIARGEFPKPLKISANRVGWPLRVITEWIRERRA